MLVTQCLEELRRVLGEGYRTLFCSLAAEQDLRWPLEPEVCHVDVARLRDACAGSGDEGQQGMIALTEQGCAIRRDEDRLQILLIEIAEHAFGGSLCRNAEHTLGDCHHLRIRSRDVVKEGADRGEPSIARAGAVVTFLLQAGPTPCSGSSLPA